MAITVCLGVYTLYYPLTGGHSWVYLNWALGLRALGCRVIWLEMVKRGRERDNKLPAYIAALKQRLERYGLADSVAFGSFARSRYLAKHMMDASTSMQHSWRICCLACCTL